MSVFQFKEFNIIQEKSPMKVGFDGILLGAWADVGKHQSALDVGTGTGVIAVMLAQRNAKLKIEGVDIDINSAKEAEKNALNCPWSDRITIHHMSIQDFAQNSHEKFDLIVTNPPFFSGGTLSSRSDRNVIRHTTRLSHQDLLMSVRKLLSLSGSFSLILPYIEGLRFIELASSYGLYNDKLLKVKHEPSQNIERLLLSFGKKNVTNCEKGDLIVKEEKDYTQDYKNLTKRFYLYM